jgi:hypothetical protein
MTEYLIVFDQWASFYPRKWALLPCFSGSRSQFFGLGLTSHALSLISLAISLVSLISEDRHYLPGSRPYLKLSRSVSAAETLIILFVYYRDGKIVKFLIFYPHYIEKDDIYRSTHTLHRSLLFLIRDLFFIMFTFLPRKISM